jgi:hypothetical protein
MALVFQQPSIGGLTRQTSPKRTQTAAERRQVLPALAVLQTHREVRQICSYWPPKSSYWLLVSGRDCRHGSCWRPGT